MKVAIYTRCNTEAQAKAKSTELQLEQIERYCKYAKHKVTAHYNDEAKSGADTDTRPEFQRLIIDAE